MTTFSLDTTVVVDITRGHAAVVNAVRTRVARGDDFVISSVVLDELVYGAAVSAAPEQEAREVQIALTMLRVEPLTAEDARLIGQFRARQRRAGRVLASYDGLIAGHAHARGWTLVTSDARLAAAVPDLHIENWRAPA